MMLVVWLASLGVDWPSLPGNARLADLLFLPVAAMMAAGSRTKWRPRTLDGLVVAYLVSGGVGLLTSTDRTVSAAELARHGYLALVYAVAALAVIRGFDAPLRVGFAAMGTALALPSLVLAALFPLHLFEIPAVGEVMNVPYAGDVLRLRSFTSSPTMFACLLTVALPFGIAGWAEATAASARRLWLGANASMIVGLALTFSHAWAGAVLAAAIASWPLLAGRRALRVAGVTAAIVLTMAFNASLVASVRSVSTVAQDRPSALSYAVDAGQIRLGGYFVEYDVMSYFRLKQLAWEAFLAHPLTGVGLDRFHEVTEAAYDQRRLTHMYRSIDPHSSLLGRLAETGIAGGVTLVALWLGLLHAGLRLASTPIAARAWLARAALAGIAGLLLVAVNVDIMNFRFFWAAAGVLRGLQEIESSTAHV